MILFETDWYPFLLHYKLIFICNQTRNDLLADEAQKVILHSGCISKILQKIKSMADLSDDELGNLPAMAFGCVNNMSGENGTDICFYFSKQNIDFR